jgi:hypothetical protein
MTRWGGWDGVAIGSDAVDDEFIQERDERAWAEAHAFLIGDHV